MDMCCKKCGYEWKTRTKLMFISCPNCGTKNKVSRLNVPTPIKNKLYKRAKNKCENCRSRDQLQIHHKIPKQQGVNNNLSNLKLLCEKCHIKEGISNRTNKDRKLIIINETFTDNEHRKLKRFKGKNLSWHDFILLMYTHCLDARKRGDFDIIQSKGGKGQNEKS